MIRIDTEYPEALRQAMGFWNNDISNPQRLVLFNLNAERIPELRQRLMAAGMDCEKFLSVHDNQTPPQILLPNNCGLEDEQIQQLRDCFGVEIFIKTDPEADQVDNQARV